MEGRSGIAGLYSFTWSTRQLDKAPAKCRTDPREFPTGVIYRDDMSVFYEKCGHFFDQSSCLTTSCLAEEREVVNNPMCYTKFSGASKQCFSCKVIWRPHEKVCNLDIHHDTSRGLYFICYAYSITNIHSHNPCANHNRVPATHCYKSPSRDDSLLPHPH